MDMKLIKKIFTDYRIPLLAVVLFAVMAIIKPNFASAYNVYSIADSIAGYGIAAIGFTFILLVGQLDISFGSVIALTACVFMMMLKAEMNFVLALFTALALAVRDLCVDGMFKTAARHSSKNPKRIYYLSLEYLLGRLLPNNLYNFEIISFIRLVTLS